MSAPTQHDHQDHRSRLLPDDPAYLRLRNVTQKRLSASVQRLVGDLRGATPADQRSALSAFVARQTAILQQAYVTSHQMGAFDYYSEVSQTPDQWSAQVGVDPERMRAALAFYAPSIAKMANEALGAVNSTKDMRLEDALEESIQLGLGSFGPRIGARGHISEGAFGGGMLSGGRRALFTTGHRLAGSTKGEHNGEHNEANVHEHLAAHHHEDEGGAGGGRRSSRGQSRGRIGKMESRSLERERQYNQERWQEGRVGQRPMSRVDENGQHMPFTHGEFRFAVDHEFQPISSHMGASAVGTVKINGKEYFVKQSADSYYHPNTEATNEIVAHDIANLMGLGRNMPEEMYHIYYDRGGLTRHDEFEGAPIEHDAHWEGAHWNIMSLEKGVQTFEQLENGNGEHHNALERALKQPDAIKQLLFEYIVSDSSGDRHEGNVMFQPRTGRIIHIDYGRAFPDSIEFKPYSSFYVSRLFATMFKVHQNEISDPTARGIAEHVKIPHEDLAGIRAVSDHILKVAEVRGLTEMTGLRTRLNVLEELSFGGDKTVADLIDTAEAYS